MEFNQINEYSLFAFFSWSMLGASSILVTLQFQIVEYKNFDIISYLNSTRFKYAFLYFQSGQMIRKKYVYIVLRFHLIYEMKMNMKQK